MKPLLPYIETIAKLTQTFSGNERAFIDAVLEAVVDVGFKSARYYEVTKDPGMEDQEVLVLRAYRHNDKKARPLPIGRSIPFETATVSKGASSDDFVFATKETSPQAAQGWIADLHLENDRWCDIPVRGLYRELVGLIALSLDSATLSAGENDRIFYSALRRSMERFQWEFQVRQILGARKKIDEFVRTHRAGSVVTPMEVAELAAKQLRSLVNAQVCAVFQYQWATRKLVKLVEVFADGRTSAMSLPEEFLVGQNITGGAWEDNKLLRIPDYQSFVERRPHLKRPETASFHEREFGRVKSILHHRFGQGFLRFLVRFVNRHDVKELPFNYVHEGALAAACEQLGEFADDLSNRLAIKQFEQLATSGIRNISDQAAITRECVSSLEDLGFNNSIILHRPRGARSFEVLHAGDERVRGAVRRQVLDPAESGLLQKISQKAGMRVWRLSDFPEPGDDQFVTALREAKVTSLIAANTGSETDGTIAFRCMFARDAQFVFGKPLFDAVNEEDVIPALLAIFSGAIEASRSTVSMDVAEQLVAYFGHEVATPISKLGQKALKAIDVAIEIIEKDPKNAKDVLALELEWHEVDQKSGQVTQQMRSAIALASKSYGSIDVRFGKFKWAPLVEEAWQEALEWQLSNEGRYLSRRIQLQKNAALSNLESVGDANLIKGILANLLKNAIKYSFAFRSEDILEIKVRAIPQTSMDIIQIENWGIGIPEEDHERIFDRFARVERIDKIRPRTGMGLGLYISRLYAKVHGGQLFCQESVPELDDIRRINELEGYRTVFELRLPKGLRPGTSKVKLT